MPKKNANKKVTKCKQITQISSQNKKTTKILNFGKKIPTLKTQQKTPQLIYCCYFFLPNKNTEDNRRIDHDFSPDQSIYSQ